MASAVLYQASGDRPHLFHFARPVLQTRSLACSGCEVGGGGEGRGSAVCVECVAGVRVSVHTHNSKVATAVRAHRLSCVVV